MIRHTQSDFKTIAEYGESIKQGEVKYAEIGNAVASWLQSSFFWLSLNSNLEPYTFQMVNTTQAQKRELEIDEMMIALVDHDKRIQFSEETKALATKMFHKKNSKKENCKRFLRYHHQLRPPRNTMEKALAITVVQYATIKNRAIFSFLLTKDRPDRSHLLEKTNC